MSRQSTGQLLVHQAGPGLTVQDLGRPGWLAQGLARGGAADRLALAEAEALLGAPGAALEMAAGGGVFSVDRPARIALTGAPMAADADGQRLVWNACHLFAPGVCLTLRPLGVGVYSYLSVGGGLATPTVMGARATHLIAGLGGPIAAGDTLALGDDPGGPVAQVLPDPARFGGGELRFVHGFQSHLFDPEVRAAFEATQFLRDARGNRQGVALIAGAARFAAKSGLTILSEPILPGDIQMTGDGVPYVLLAECQTTGGYPRIGTVIPPDLPIVAQAAPGASLRFRRISVEEAVTEMQREATSRAALARQLRPLVRDPSVADLLSHNLISGVWPTAQDGHEDGLPG